MIDSCQIDHIIHVGDLFDNRVSIDIDTLARATDYFLQPLRARNVKLTMICGNHDLYYKQSSVVSSCDHVFTDNKNVTVHKSACHLDNNIIIVPWINKENRQSTLQTIELSHAKYVFGHLELAGFQMYRGVVAKTGDDHSIFGKFDHVYSGHFHHKNSQANITYLGNNQQQTWSDYGDVRGFHIFDDHTGRLDFIANPNNMFEYLSFDDQLTVVNGDWNVEDKFVRINIGEVKRKTNLDKFVEHLYKSGAADIKIIPQSAGQITEIDQQQVQHNDTPTLITSVVPAGPIQDKLLNLYSQALQIQ